MPDNNEKELYERYHAIQFQTLGETINEMKQRIQRLESLITRGLLLLVANLTSILVIFGQQMWSR